MQHLHDFHQILPCDAHGAYWVSTCIPRPLLLSGQVCVRSLSSSCAHGDVPHYGLCERGIV
jgi:hypothetical protein